MGNKNLSDFELPDNRKIKIKIKKFKTVKPLNEMTLFSVKICRNEFLKVKKNVLLNYITRKKSLILYIFNYAFVLIVNFVFIHSRGTRQHEFQIIFQ